MSHIGEVVERYRAPIDRFIEVENRYCALIEAWLEHPERFDDRQDFLIEVERLLPQIYSAALELPETSELFEDDDEPEDEDDARPAEAHAEFDRNEHQRSLVERFPSLAVYDFDFVDLRLYSAIESYLGNGISHYQEISDPYAAAFSEQGADEVTASLGDNLASVYAWLKKATLIWLHSSDEAQFEALWDWRFELESHSGAHFVDGLRAIHWLLHYHAPDDEDDS